MILNIDDQGFMSICREHGDQLGLKGMAELYMCYYCQIELELDMEYGQLFYDYIIEAKK